MTFSVPQLVMQLVYLGLTILHFSIFTACISSHMSGKAEKGRWATFLLILFAVSNLFEAAGFFVSLIITGSTPIRPRAQYLPWAQISFILDFLTLAIPVSLGTYKGFQEILISKPKNANDSN